MIFLSTTVSVSIEFVRVDSGRVDRVQYDVLALAVFILHCVRRYQFVMIEFVNYLEMNLVAINPTSNS